MSASHTRALYRNKGSNYFEALLGSQLYFRKRKKVGYMGPEINLFGKTRGTRVFVTINICSENISVLSAKSVKDMLTVLSSIGWLLSDLSFIGWLLLMRTYKLGQACPTVP